VAAYLAVMFAQAGFIGHDAGHRQILASRRGNYVLGVLHGNLGIGLSYGWWVSKHNRHHAHPNTEGADPDIVLAAVAFAARQARLSRGPARLLYRWQAWLLFPMLLLEAVSIHAASIRALASRATPGRVWEAAALAGDLAGCLAVVALVLPPVKAAVFIAVRQGLFGLYLGCSFAPNHKGMPILGPGDRQIEHHLFPSMPRPNLGRSRQLTEALCRQRGIPYCQASRVGSYRQALRHLAATGRLTRATPGGC
jgi:fatty acid desaturase